MQYHKVVIKLIKYVPAIQLAGTLIRSAMQITDNKILEYIIDFCCGTTLISTVIFILGSYMFKFCYIHRLLIVSTFINDVIISGTNIINLYDYNINIQHISHYFCNIILFIFIYKSIKYKTDYDTNIKIIKKLVNRVCEENR